MDTFKKIFIADTEKIYRIPAYQRAYAWDIPASQWVYAWKKEQWELFWENLVKLSAEENPKWYFGYFMVKQEGSNYDIILDDSKQFLTTIALFYLACGKPLPFTLQVPEYDQVFFESIKKGDKLEGEITMSAQRMYDAVEFFREEINKKENKQKVDQYIKVIEDATCLMLPIQGNNR
jgi:uncharacterized protein with ParB-like and HNH nuclease domain